MSKVLEKLLLTRLKIYTTSKIRLDQHGFKSAHSTITQLFRIIDDISLNLNNKRITAVILLVVEKSFDKVRHDDLISKLIDLGVPSDIITILTPLRINTSRLKSKTKIYLS